VTVATARVEQAELGTLARCAGDVGRFVAEDWGRRASVTRSGEHAGFDDLLTLDDVDRFLTTTALRTPFFRLVKAGERIPETAYTRSGRAGSRDVAGIADPAAVAAFFEDGATIVLQGLHRWSEPVMHFNRGLEIELGHACQVNAYITPSEAQGLELHEDPHDVFVLQAFGSKRWQVHAAPGEGEREPLDVEVSPGDAIYMPRGTPHAASAQRTVSGHLTVGVHVTSWRDVLASAWRAAVADPSSDEALPPGWTRDRAGLAAELYGRVQGAAERLLAVDAGGIVAERAERFLSVRAQLARGSIAERAAPIRIDDDTLLMRRPDSVCELAPDDDGLVVLLGDRRLRLPRWLTSAMERIAGTDMLRLGDLCDVVPDATSRAVLARRLVREGLLTTDRIDRAGDV
jgi:bifunctional lysine-specific demethylase and histidyl-hydroxylase NO66